MPISVVYTLVYGRRGILYTGNITLVNAFWTISFKFVQVFINNLIESTKYTCFFKYPVFVITKDRIFVQPTPEQIRN